LFHPATLGSRVTVAVSVGGVVSRVTWILAVPTLLAASWATTVSVLLPFCSETVAVQV